MTILAISPALKHTSLLEPPSHKHAYESYSAANLVMVPTRNMLAEAAVGNCRAFHGLFVPLQITAGLRHSMALTDKRKLWAWGDNSEGQLGTAVPTPCLVPTPVHAFPAEATIMYVVAGGEHSLAAVQNLGFCYLVAGASHSTCGLNAEGRAWLLYQGHRLQQAFRNRTHTRRHAA